MANAFAGIELLEIFLFVPPQVSVFARHEGTAKIF